MIFWVKLFVNWKKDKVFWNYGCVDFYKFIDFVKGRINYEIWKTKDKKSVHAVS